MSVYIAGLGAVSPAGWGVPALVAAVKGGAEIAPQEHVVPGSTRKLRMRAVPAPATRPAFLAHPRLRRASPLSQYIAGAATEALSNKPSALDGRQLTIVSCLQSGPVQYACRFYGEVLKEPGQASPLLFPETVFSAPASHIASVLGLTPCATTFLGDPGAFLQGIAQGAAWLMDGKADLCLVLGGEEFNWVVSSAAWHLDRKSILAPGAGAILLSTDPALSMGAKLDCITDSHTYSPGTPPLTAGLAMKAELPVESANDLLVDGVGGADRLGIVEEQVWKDWPGIRVSPKRILGEGLMAGSTWQFAIAANEIAQGKCPAGVVSVIGCNQQAIGARLVSGTGAP